MKWLFKMTIFGILAFFFWWYVSWSINPYRYCLDHSDKKKRADFYEHCEPFDIEMKASWRFIDDPENRGERYYDKVLKESSRVRRNKKEEESDSNSLDYYK